MEILYKLNQPAEPGWVSNKESCGCRMLSEVGPAALLNEDLMPACLAWLAYQDQSRMALAWILQ